MDAPPRIPPGALSGLEGWDATIAWSFVPEKVTWRLHASDGEIRFLKVCRLGQQISLEAERDRMVWVGAHLSVPQVLDYGADSEHEWLLTAGLPGIDATKHDLRADPPRLVPLLADGLRRFHALPVGSCPFDRRADVMLRIVHQRVQSGLVDAARDFHVEHSALTVEAAIEKLVYLQPQQEDLVVCHGDYCLPNVLISDARVSGYVDLGELGVADRWWDLAVATWSVTWNLGPGWEDLFLETYGVERDAGKAAFYRLLYDLA